MGFDEKSILAYLFIYLFIQHLLARPKTANKHERSGDSQPRQAKREKKERKKKERCCQRGKGDRERKRNLLPGQIVNLWKRPETWPKF